MIKTIVITAVAGLFSIAASPAKNAFSDFSKYHGTYADTTKKSDSTGLKAGDKCPDVVFKDTSGKDVKLSQFKGKYVYIDIWASWCGPCKKEYPKMQEVIARMKGKNIVFVGISCDETEWRWKAAVKWENMNGNQWIIKDETFMNAFRVGSVPRYILLDTKGTIIDPKMLRPSDPEMEKNLNNLKKI